MVDVLSAAWIGARGPLPADLAAEGVCARCGTAGRLSPVADVVSKNFTAYDGWIDPSGGGLCATCVWGYRTVGLRQHAHVVSHAPAALRCLELAELARVLSAPVPRSSAVIVPLRRGRQHLLPAAAWGRVTVDGAQLGWTSSDVERLQIMATLRAEGVGPRAFSASAPPFSIVRRLPSTRWADLMVMWDQLAAWRASALWLRLGLLATSNDLPAAA